MRNIFGFIPTTTPTIPTGDGSFPVQTDREDGGTVGVVGVVVGMKQFFSVRSILNNGENGNAVRYES